MSVAQAGTEVVLTTREVMGKKRKVVSLGLNAMIRAMTPGGGFPNGMVTFEVRSKGKKKVLGTAMLANGSATLAVKPSRVRQETITILYGGDADFSSSQETTTIHE